MQDQDKKRNGEWFTKVNDPIRMSGQEYYQSMMKEITEPPLALWLGRNPTMEELYAEMAKAAKRHNSINRLKR